MDCNKFYNLSYIFLYVIISPLMIIFGFLYLYFLVGPSLFVGLGTTVIAMLINVMIVKRRMKFYKEFMKVSAVRIKRFNEAFNNIIFLKANNYENHFFNRINDVRQVEMKWNKKYFFNSAVVVSGLYVTSTVLYIATFTTYILLGHIPTASMIFTFISIYENIQFAINFLPSLLSLFVDILGSSQRLIKFLFLEEILPPKNNFVEGQEWDIVLKDATYMYGKKSDEEQKEEEKKKGKKGGKKEEKK